MISLNDMETANTCTCACMHIIRTIYVYLYIQLTLLSNKIGIYVFTSDKLVQLFLS